MIEPETQAYSYTTYSQFCARVRRVAFPEGLGERSKSAFDNFLVAGLIKAQRFIDCLRKIQVSFYGKPEMSDHCAIATLLGPRGKVNLVYAFKPGEQCIKHAYRPATPHHIACWSNENSCRWADPPGVGTEDYLSSFEACYAYEQLYGAIEDDRCWKVEPKFFSRGQNSEIFLAPRPPCGYIVAVHWEGLRRKWSATDSIPDDQDLIDWVAEYVLSEFELRLNRDANLAGAMKVNSANKFADLMYWCNAEKMAQASLDCAHGIDTGNLNHMFLPIYPYPNES
jgi:hypothetical protein